jgi:hypothetical protein
METYRTPKLDVIEFDTEDVMTASGDFSVGGGDVDVDLGDDGDDG